MKYNGFIIPQGTTIFVNACKLKEFVCTPVALNPFQGVFFTTQVDLSSFSPGVKLYNNVSELYDDPENFIPDRYLLTENGTKPGVDGSDLRPTYAFGVGRVSPISVSTFLISDLKLKLQRICPGIHLAQNSIVRRLITPYLFSCSQISSEHQCYEPRLGLQLHHGHGRGGQSHRAGYIRLSKGGLRPTTVQLDAHVRREF